MIPLCTTRNSFLGSDLWGWQLRSEGGPWVAQRVWAMPECTWKVCESSREVFARMTFSSAETWGLRYGCILFTQEGAGIELRWKRACYLSSCLEYVDFPFIVAVDGESCIP